MRVLVRRQGSRNVLKGPTYETSENRTVSLAHWRARKAATALLDSSGTSTEGPYDSFRSIIAVPGSVATGTGQCETRFRRLSGPMIRVPS